MSKPIIDLELGKKIIDGDEARAKEMLGMLNDMLPEHKRILQEAHQAQDLEALKNEAHKLRGGVSYCGTPRLLEAASQLEIALKTNQESAEDLYEELIKEIAVFKQAYKKILL